MGLRGKPLRPMPADFEAHMDEPIDVLRERYHTSWECVQRWKDLCGFERQQGSPRPVLRIDRAGHMIRFPSIVRAAECTEGGTPPKICSALRRGGKSCGYWWEYAEGK